MAGEVSAIFQNFAKSLPPIAVSLKGWSIEHNVFFFKFSFTGNSDFHVIDGRCKQHILYTPYFTACGSRLSSQVQDASGE